MTKTRFNRGDVLRYLDPITPNAEPVTVVHAGAYRAPGAMPGEIVAMFPDGAGVVIWEKWCEPHPEYA